MGVLQGAKTNEFGRRVLGDDAWRKQEDAKRAESTGGVRFGGRVVDPGPSPAPAAETKPAPVETTPPVGETTPPVDETSGSEAETVEDQVPSPFGKGPLPSVAETEKILAESPDFFDDAYAAEMMAPQPRKSALDLLLRIERNRPSPRPKIIQGLERMRAGGSE